MIKSHDDGYSFAAVFKEEEKYMIRDWAAEKMMMAISKAYAHDIVLVGVLDIQKLKIENSEQIIKRIVVSFCPTAEFRA